MSRISIPTREQALPETHQILDDVQRRLGFIPNVCRRDKATRRSHVEFTALLSPP